MATINTELNVKTTSGYDQLNVKTDSNIVSYINTNMTATNVKSAIDELYSEKAEKVNAEFTNSISMGRKYGTTVGVGSAVIGSLGEASGENSTALGQNNTASGYCSMAIGNYTICSTPSSFSSGNYTRAEGYISFASGDYSVASGGYSTASGENTLASGIASNANNSNTTAEGDHSSSFGLGARARGYVSFSAARSTTPSIVSSIPIGSTAQTYINTWNNTKFSVASGNSSHVIGEDCMGLGNYSKASGYQTIAEGDYSSTKGRITRATGICSSAKGYNTRTTTNGDYGSVEGYNGSCEAIASHVEGAGGYAFGDASHVEGYNCMALGNYGHSGGYRTTALANQYAIGHFNNPDLAITNTSSGTSTGSAFVIGNGIEGVGSNAFRVTGDGLVYAKGAYSASGADLAEIYEWQDENKSNQDRRALFVTNDGTKIKIAEKGDYILGIISSAPCIIGNGDECWVGAYEKDEHGSYIYETKLIEVKRKVPTTKTIQVEEEFPTYNEETNKMETVIKMVDKVVIEEEEVVEDVAQQFYKVNPLYDPTRPYKQRLDRPEFDAVGIKGMLTLIDDGTCEVNGFCKCGGKGIATKCEREPFDTFRVIERIDDKLVKVAI